MDAFKKRRIDVTIYQRGGGTAGDAPSDPVTLTGYRCILTFHQYNTTSQGRLDMVIYGMPLEMMNRLTQIGMVRNKVYNNPIIVTAGNEGEPMMTVYRGCIAEAASSFDGMPNVGMRISALSMLSAAVIPVGPRSYQGAVDVATILQDLAHSMNVTYSGPQSMGVVLKNPYFSGTDYDQYKACVAAAPGVCAVIANGTMEVWPRDGFVHSNPVLISPATGLVGYPSFSRNGVILNTLFNGNVRLGHQVRVESSLTPACGLWNVFSIQHNLSSETPDGPWFTQILASPAEPKATGATP